MFVKVTTPTTTATLNKVPALISLLYLIAPINCQTINNAGDVGLVFNDGKGIAGDGVKWQKSANSDGDVFTFDGLPPTGTTGSMDAKPEDRADDDAPNRNRTLMALLCRSYVLRFGQTSIKASNRPHGTCRACCSINRNRDIRFILFKRNKPNVGKLISLPSKSGNARRSGVNRKRQTIIFIHGFSETSPGPSGLTIKNAYFARNLSVNFIVLDWSELAPFPWYAEAVDNVKHVRKALVKFLQTYDDSGEMPLANVHVIGFSLGAQVAGFAGKYLRKGLRIPRITALDPAYPMFPIEDPDSRLAETDAVYVDVIHTDGGVLGFPNSVGHADFYPNGGRSTQPGCTTSNSGLLINRILACNHLRSWKYYAESVRKPFSFPSTRCDDWLTIDKSCNFTLDAYMGFPSDQNTTTSGNFYLVTNDIYPYSMDVDQQKRFPLAKNYQTTT